MMTKDLEILNGYKIIRESQNEFINMLLNFAYNVVDAYRLTDSKSISESILKLTIYGKIELADKIEEEMEIITNNEKHDK